MCPSSSDLLPVVEEWEFTDAENACGDGCTAGSVPARVWERLA